MSEDAAVRTHVLLQPLRAWRSLHAFLKRNVTPRAGAAIAVWRVEARLATPVALLLVATLGRWNGALAMGGIMACYSALFLFLLEGEPVMDELRGWMRERRWAQRYALPIAERRDRVGAVQRALALPASVMLMGPFWRALTYHLFRLPRAASYTLSVGGSIPHSLFWTGLVLGGLWEAAIRPLLGRLL
ncbi:MAG: hypothetical protein Q7T33_14580 [Dehalococcoidia bacterium]|nr:hypothetical protein [Dehalococcoidia bacterium]